MPANLLFILLLGLQGLFFWFLVAQSRVPVGHDGFHIFTMQYFFLNNAVVHGEVPQWMPFMTHGTTATWWYSVQGVCGLLTNALFHCAELIRNTNFLGLYYASMFLDELLLLVGTWLLAKRFFSSPLTILFVCVSVLGSSIWATQPYFNFYHFYTLPLIIYFIHRLLDEGRWLYLFFAAHLFGMQIITSDAYVIPLVSMVVAMYFLFYALCDFKQVAGQVRNLKFDRRFYGAFLGSIFSMAMVGLILKAGMDPQLVNFNHGRGTEGAVPLNVFLTYSAGTGGIEWRDLILRFSPGADSTLYIGFLSLAFIVIGFLRNLNPSSKHIACLVLFLLIFSASTVVSVLFYYVWPLMKYFRHLALVSPVAKFFVCFLAGFGLDYILTRNPQDKTFRWIMTMLALGMGFLSVYLWDLATHRGLLQAIPALVSKVGLLLFIKPFEHPTLLRSQFEQSAFYAFWAALLLLSLVWIRRDSLRLFLFVGLLVFHIFDVYGYKFFEYKMRTMALSPQQKQLCRFQKIPYSPRRGLASPEVIKRMMIAKDTYKKTVSSYWGLHTFTFFDPLQTPLITYNWQIPFGDMLRAFEKQSIRNKQEPPASYVPDWRLLNFPVQNIPARKIAGADEDKVQFFRNVHFGPSDDAIAECLASPSYKGNLVFASDARASGKLDCHDAATVAGDERLHLPYQVLDYSANRIKLQADVSAMDPVWMMYSDAWHPLWQATINAQPTPIYKANLSYKAVLLNPGSNTVEFIFKSSYINWLQKYFGWSALFWILAIIFLAVRLCLGLGSQQAVRTRG